MSVQVERNVQLDLDRSLPYYHEKAYASDWDHLHHRFSCCGSSSSADFAHLVPLSCSSGTGEAGTVEAGTGMEASSEASAGKHEETRVTGCRAPVASFIRSKSASMGSAFLSHSILWLAISLLACSSASALALRS